MAKWCHTKLMLFHDGLPHLHWFHWTDVALQRHASMANPEKGVNFYVTLLQKLGWPGWVCDIEQPDNVYGKRL